MENSSQQNSVVPLQQPVQAPNVFDRSAFLSSLDTLATNLNARYAPMIKLYSEHLIPLEASLRKNAQRAEGNYNQRQKIELLGRVQKLTVEKSTLQTTTKILSDRYEIQMLENSKLKDDNTQLRESLDQLTVQMVELKSNIQDKLKAISTIQQDKNKLVEQLEVKQKEYNRLLESYMKDQNLLAQRLNTMNALEEEVLQKQKRLDEDRFYLENQKKSYQEKKSKDKVTKPASQKEIAGDKLDFKNLKTKIETEQKQQAVEYARTPFKKIIKHHSSQIYGITASYNGNLLATCGGDRTIKIYDPLNQKTVTSIVSNSAENIFISLHLNYVGDRVVVGSTDYSVSIYGTSSGKQLGCYVGHGEKVNAVAFTNSKEKCVSGGDDRQLKFWDVEKGSNISSISCGKSVKIITPNLAEPVVYSGHGDGSIRVYSVNQGSAPLSQIRGLIDHQITSITLSSNRNHLLVGSRQGSNLSVFDLRASKIFKKYEDSDFFNSGQHFRADYSPTEKYVLAGNYDGSIIYWDTNSQKRICKLTGHEGTVTAVLYHPFTNILSSTDSKGNMILWN